MKKNKHIIQWLFITTFMLCVTILAHPEVKAGVINNYVVNEQQPIKGQVTDSAGKALSGVSIQIKRDKKGTFTDAEGRFSIEAQKGDILIVSYVGYETQYITVADNTNMTIRLNPAKSALTDVVVVGYGTQKRSSLTASVATIKGDDLAHQPVGDLSNSLGGRAAGILFTQGGGQAGNDAANIMVRGIGTNGNSAPLLIVDGIQRPFGQLNPEDIASFSILKDAAAVAPYGLAGANGVILVTTKRGKVGKPVFSYDAYVGWQNPTVVFHDMSSYDYARLMNMAATNSGNQPAYTDAMLQKFKDGSDPDVYPSTDPLADILKKNALQTSHSLSLSGGTEKVRYAVGLGYYFQDGLIPNVNYKRFNLSSNLDIEATKTTTVSINLSGRVEQRHFSGHGTNMQGIFENLINTSPTTTFKYTNGGFGDEYASFYASKSYNKQVSPIMLTSASLKQLLPLPGLSVKLTFSYDLYPTFTRNWNEPYSYTSIADTAQHPYVYSIVEPTTLPSFNESYNQSQNFTYQGQLDYSRQFGKSAVTGLIVLEAITKKNSNFYAGRTNYQVFIPELNSGSSASADISNGGNGSIAKQRSMVYRVTYGFDNKYMLEAAGRYDGHYYFAPGKRYAFFPAFSAGWRISQEKFMQNIPWITELKLRGSWGKSGNLAGAPFQFLTLNSLYPNSTIIGGAAVSGLREGVPGANGGQVEGNPDITWEVAKKTDIGLDATLWNGLISFQADYFYEKRSNMLIVAQTKVPLEYGIGLPEMNLGVMSNQGVEFSLNVNKQLNNDWHIGLNSNFTYAKNKLIQVYESAFTYDVPGRRQTGRALGTPFGYKAIGFFTKDDFDTNGDLKTGIPTPQWGAVAPGDIKYEDVNANGKIDVDDQIAMGYPTYPEIIYGFSPSVRYKNLELSFLFQGAANRSVQLSGSSIFLFEQGRSAPSTALDYWTPDNLDATYPRITTSIGANNSATSTFWERNAGYLRLKTMMLSYNLPKQLIKHAGMKAVKIYVSGQNLITWTQLENFDPEVSTNSMGGNSGRGWYFPISKSVTVGASIQF